MNLGTPAVVLLALVTTGLLVFQNWRYSLFCLALLYIGEFILVLTQWPLELAVVKVLTGWVASIVLGFVLIAEESVSASVGMDLQLETEVWPTNRLFRLITAGLVILVVFSIAPAWVDWAPGISVSQWIGGLILLSMGLVQLGVTSQPLRIILGLLMLMAGFEVIYSSLESSILVAGLLAVINLGLSFVGAYLLVVHSWE